MLPFSMRYFSMSIFFFITDFTVFQDLEEKVHSVSRAISSIYFGVFVESFTWKKTVLGFLSAVLPLSLNVFLFTPTSPLAPKKGLVNVLSHGYWNRVSRPFLRPDVPSFLILFRIMRQSF